MSKKIMRRSLALGALMAFVITGSAMAADVSYADFITNADSSKVITVNGETVVTGDGSSLANYKLNVAQGTKLTLNEVYGVKNVIGNGDLYINNSANKAAMSDGASFVGKNLYVVANDNDYNGRYDRVLSYVYGTVNITAEETVSFDTGDHCIHTEGSNGKVTITAKDIIMKSGQRPIMNSGGADVIITATNSVKFESVGGIYNWAANQDGKIEIKGKTVELVSPGSYVIQNGGNGVVSVEAEEELIVKSTGSSGVAIKLVDNGGNGGEGDIILKSNGNTVVEGDILNNSKGDIDASFEGEGSSLTGKVETNGSGDTNLTFNDATWNVTGESNVSKIDGTGANIKVDEIKENLVTIEEKGVDTELTVTTSSDNFEGSAEEGMAALANVVANGEGEAVADKLVATAGAMYDKVTADVENGTVTNVDKTVAAANVSVNNMSAIGLMSWRAEMNDMNKRMGELRNANGEHGVWVRMVRGESEYNSVKNQYNQYQLGYDEKLSVDKRWTVGVALSYTDAENNFALGNGESTNKALSVYGSKLNEDGTFIDLIAKYARLENDFTTYSGQGAGEYDANGYSFSAEIGKRIQQGNGLWIEPQVELTYGKVGSADYVTENNVKVAQDSMDSIVGRVGFSLGKDIKDGNVYARASYLYDFDGETKAVLNGVESLEQDLGGGWWEVGVGANINLSKATYIYADIEKTFGGEVDTNWQWNLGVRYSF